MKDSGNAGGHGTAKKDQLHPLRTFSCTDTGDLAAYTEPHHNLAAAKGKLMADTDNGIAHVGAVTWAIQCRPSGPVAVIIVWLPSCVTLSEFHCLIMEASIVSDLLVRAEHCSLRPTGTDWTSIRDSLPQD